MEESTNQILQYDSRLNSNIAEIIELFNETSQTKTYSLSKIDCTLVRTIEDAQGIIKKYNSMIYLFFIKNSYVFFIFKFQ